PRRLQLRGETFVIRIVRMPVPAAALVPSPPAVSWVRRHAGIAVPGKAAAGTAAAGRGLAPVLACDTVPCISGTVSRVTCPCGAGPCGAGPCGAEQPATIPATAQAS